jgi:hypothetical protein
VKGKKAELQPTRLEQSSFFGFIDGSPQKCRMENPRKAGADPPIGVAMPG